jgi:hypothetical protein
MHIISGHINETELKMQIKLMIYCQQTDHKDDFWLILSTMVVLERGIVLEYPIADRPTFVCH